MEIFSSAQELDLANLIPETPTVTDEGYSFNGLADPREITAVQRNIKTQFQADLTEEELKALDMIDEETGLYVEPHHFRLIDASQPSSIYVSSGVIEFTDGIFSTVDPTQVHDLRQSSLPSHDGIPNPMSFSIVETTAAQYQQLKMQAERFSAMAARSGMATGEVTGKGEVALKIAMEENEALKAKLRELEKASTSSSLSSKAKK